MLALNDGRNELWQWDTGRKLTVDADCSQVHFSNKILGQSIDVDVVDGVAIIPDILLQTDRDLAAWAFFGTPQDGYTKVSKVFKVNKRNKPADYVFTPVEQITIKKIEAIAQSVRDDADSGTFDGDDGFSPILSVTEIKGGHRVTITDASGHKTFDVMNGKDGKDGQAQNSSVYRATDHGISTASDDNTPALQALINAVSSSGGGIIFFPVGTYNFMQWTSSDYRWAVEMKSNVSIIGENLEKTVLKQTEEKPYALFGRILANGEGATNPLTGCTFQNFTIDAYATGNRNHVCAKAFYFQYVRDCVFRDLRLMGTIATALGIDFLDRVVIDNVSCIDCGRTFTGDESGTSGIGIGTAGWENENFIITNCICDGCGQYGIFIENQGIFYDGNVPYAKGCVISNCIVRNGINKGIGVRGGQNVTVIGCESYENASHGIFIDNNCKNVKIISCSGANNGGSGIFVTPNNTEHLLIKGCTFVNNQAEGIKVSIDAGKNANKLCIQDCYTDGNAIGIDLSANTLADCVILGNATLDGVNNGTTFTGNTAFNDFVGGDAPDVPVETTIAVPFSSMTNGKKLMPDGSLADEAGANSTVQYIDVSMLNDTFGLFYPGAMGGDATRIAQYDANKNSLGTSFGLVNGTVIEDYTVWKVKKLDGCKYVRIFLAGGFAGLDGELRNLEE